MTYFVHRGFCGVKTGMQWYNGAAHLVTSSFSLSALQRQTNAWEDFKSVRWPKASSNLSSSIFIFHLFIIYLSEKPRVEINSNRNFDTFRRLAGSYKYFFTIINSFKKRKRIWREREKKNRSLGYLLHTLCF